MKRINIFKIAAISLILTFLTISCERNSELTEYKDLTNSVGNFCPDCGSDIGIHHNNILTMIEANWSISDTNFTKQDVINQVISNSYAYLIDSMYLSPEEANNVINNIMTSSLINICFPDDPTGYPDNVNWGNLITNSLDSLMSMNNANQTILTLREYNFIINGYNIIFEDDYSGMDYITTTSTMIDKANLLIQQWNSTLWEEDEGILACFFLSISKRSSEYARDYDFGSDPQNIPSGPMVARAVSSDVGGGILGAAVGVMDGLLSDGEVNWGSVASRAIEGAVFCTFPGIGSAVGGKVMGWLGKARNLIRR